MNLNSISIHQNKAIPVPSIITMHHSAFSVNNLNALKPWKSSEAARTLQSRSKANPLWKVIRAWILHFPTN